VRRATPRDDATTLEDDEHRPDGFSRDLKLVGQSALGADRPAGDVRVGIRRPPRLKLISDPCGQCPRPWTRRCAADDRATTRSTSFDEAERLQHHHDTSDDLAAWNAKLGRRRNRGPGRKHIAVPVTNRELAGEPLDLALRRRPRSGAVPDRWSPTVVEHDTVVRGHNLERCGDGSPVDVELRRKNRAALDARAGFRVGVTLLDDGRNLPLGHRSVGLREHPVRWDEPRRGEHSMAT
jgi:hypothetical protein